MLALCLPLGAMLAWQGGAWALLGIACSSVPAGWLWWKRQAQTEPTTQAVVSEQILAPKRPARSSPAAGVATYQRNPMVSVVVPVWARQLETTRTSADTGLSSILNAFSDMSGSLDTLLSSLEGMSTSAQPGAVDHAVGASAAPLSALLAPSQRAFDLRDRAYAELDQCGQFLEELLQLARQAKEIGRHTRLVAFNASIEASRESKSDGGNQAVAHEMRLLATRMSDNGNAVYRVVNTLSQRVDALRHASVTEDTAPAELKLELEMRAREALQSLMSAVGASLSTSGSVREASAALRSHLDDAFVHFQFGDRVSQMLAIVGNDMNNFVDWVGHNPQANVDDANEWLRRLESSYTMEEQRCEHHGNVHVDRGSEVEFF